MTDQPRRQFWQIHLSTAVLMMFVAGGLLWLNLLHSGWWDLHTKAEVGQGDMFGFPATVLETGWTAQGVDSAGKLLHGRTVRDWLVGGIIANVLFDTIILVSFAYFCEWLLRRREARPK